MSRSVRRETPRASPATRVGGAVSALGRAAPALEAWPPRCARELQARGAAVSARRLGRAPSGSEATRRPAGSAAGGHVAERYVGDRLRQRPVDVGTAVPGVHGDRPPHQGIAGDYRGPFTAQRGRDSCARHDDRGARPADNPVAGQQE